MILAYKNPRVSLFLLVLFNLKNDRSHADDGFLNTKTWGQQLYYHNTFVKGVNNEYEFQDNDDLNTWVLDEEQIFAPYTKTPHQTTLQSIESELWWKVTNQDDPAMDAEPALWDGDGLVNNVSSKLFLDYELLQNKWEEAAVT